MQSIPKAYLAWLGVSGIGFSHADHVGLDDRIPEFSSGVFRRIHGFRMPADRAISPKPKEVAPAVLNSKPWALSAAPYSLHPKP